MTSCLSVEGDGSGFFVGKTEGFGVKDRCSFLKEKIRKAVEGVLLFRPVRSVREVGERSVVRLRAFVGGRLRVAVDTLQLVATSVFLLAVALFGSATMNSICLAFIACKSLSSLRHRYV